MINNQTMDEAMRTAAVVCAASTACAVASTPLAYIQHTVPQHNFSPEVIAGNGQPVNTPGELYRFLQKRGFRQIWTPLPAMLLFTSCAQLAAIFAFSAVRSVLQQGGGSSWSLSPTAGAGRISSVDGQSFGLTDSVTRSHLRSGTVVSALHSAAAGLAAGVAVTAHAVTTAPLREYVRPPSMAPETPGETKGKDAAPKVQERTTIGEKARAARAWWRLNAKARSVHACLSLAAFDQIQQRNPYAGHADAAGVISTFVVGAAVSTAAGWPAALLHKAAVVAEWRCGLPGANTAPTVFHHVWQDARLVGPVQALKGARFYRVFPGALGICVMTGWDCLRRPPRFPVASSK